MHLWPLGPSEGGGSVRAPVSQAGTVPSPPQATGPPRGSSVGMSLMGTRSGHHVPLSTPMRGGSPSACPHPRAGRRREKTSLPLTGQRAGGSAQPEPRGGKEHRSHAPPAGDAAGEGGAAWFPLPRPVPAVGTGVLRLRFAPGPAHLLLTCSPQGFLPVSRRKERQLVPRND